jgi:hypothetical protein
MSPWFEGIVDLKTYPILDLGSPQAQELIQRCRNDLLLTGAVELKGFVTAVGVETLVRESETIESKAHHNVLQGNAYLEEPEASLPADDVRRLMERTALGALGYDQIPSSHLLRKLYEWESLMGFVGAVLELPAIYRYADPMGALNLSVMGEGDYLRWHFDQTDFVTSLAVRTADEGGEFEYVPMIRNEKNPNYERVREIIQGGRDRVVRIQNEPGTLVLFKGRDSIHRVTEIRGRTTRLMGLFGYDRQPGVMSSEYLRKIRYGRTVPMQSEAGV